MSKRKHDNENVDMSVKKPKPDNRIIYHSVATLKNLAGAKIAIALWLHQNIRNIRPSLGFDWQSPVPENKMLQTIYDTIEEEVFRNKLCFSNTAITEVLSSFDTLDLIKKIKYEVGTYPEMIRKELEEWKNYQFRRIFFDRDQKEVFKYLDEVEWRPNGVVDYLASAKNMLKSPKITEMEKFRVACTYCLKEEIDNVSPLLFTNKYRELVLFENHPLIYYWNCYITKEWHRIPVVGFNSVESKMITMKNVDNDCALKYFFSKFSEQDNLDNAKLLIRLYGVKYQIFALSQLNEAQQRQVFEQMAPEIITNFATPWLNSAHAVRTWHHVKDFITGPQFVEIIGNLLDLWISEDERGFFHLSVLITKIWRTASQDLKRCGVDYIENDEQILADVLDKPFLNLLNGSSFLLAMLPDLSDDTKKNMIRSDGCFSMFGELIDSRKDVHLIQKFIKVCLPDENKAREFKKDITRTRVFRRRCIHLCSVGAIEIANKLIAKFLPDSKAVDVYREELFMSYLGFHYFGKKLDNADIEFSFLRTQIEKALPRNDKDFVRKFILSDEIIEKFHDWILGNYLDDVKVCLEEFRCDEILIEEVKTLLFYSYQGYHIISLFSELDAEKSGEFLLWCLNGENNVSNWKNKLPFDLIYQKMLEESVFEVYDHKVDTNCVARFPCDFSSLDGFLQWYFGNNEAVRKFKIDQINNFQRIEIFNRHRSDSWGFWSREQNLVKTIFQFHFDDNRNEIEKFKASNKFCKFDIHEL